MDRMRVNDVGRLARNTLAILALIVVLMLCLVAAILWHSAGSWRHYGGTPYHLAYGTCCAALRSGQTELGSELASYTERGAFEGSTVPRYHVPATRFVQWFPEYEAVLPNDPFGRLPGVVRVEWREDGVVVHARAYVGGAASNIRSVHLFGEADECSVATPEGRVREAGFSRPCAFFHEQLRRRRGSGR